MKKLFFMMTCLLASLAVSAAESTVLLHETFGVSDAGKARAWQDEYKVQTGVIAVYSSATYTITEAKQSKSDQGSTGSCLQATQEKEGVFEVGPLNVANCSNMKITYQWNAGSVSKTYSTQLYYKTSTDGEYTEVIKTSGTGSTKFGLVEYSLPATANVSTLYLKVSFYTSNTNAKMDEFELTGTMAPADPSAPSLTVSPTITSWDFGTIGTGGSFAAKEFTVTGKNLSAKPTFTLLEGTAFDFTDNTTFADGAISGTISVSCTATAADTYYDILTVTAADADNLEAIDIELNAAIVSITGAGTKDNPYTVADMKVIGSTLSDSVWVKGYILGSVKKVDDKPVINTTYSASNISLGDTQDATDVIGVGLASGGAARATLNLEDNAYRLGAPVKVYGKVDTYYGGIGLSVVKNTYELIPVAATDLTLNKTSAELKQGTTLTLTATPTPLYTTDEITWSSDKEEIATVENGVVTAKAKGTAVITAKAGTVEAKCSVEVVLEPVITITETALDFGSIKQGKETFAKKTVAVEVLNLTNAPEYEISAGKEHFTATGDLTAADGGTITVTCTATEIGTYTGELYIIGDGDYEKTITLTAEITDPTLRVDVLTADDFVATNNNYKNFSNVTNNSVDLGVIYAGNNSNNNNGISIRKSDSDQAKSGIVITASDAKVTQIVFNWNSSTNRTVQIYGKATAYASIDDLYNTDDAIKGSLLTTSTGQKNTTTVTFTDEQPRYIGLVSSDGACVFSSIEITWKEIPPVEATSITLEDITLEQYREGAIVANIEPADAKITWESNDKTIATVDKNGVVTAVAEGETAIIAKSASGALTKSCKVTVTKATPITCAKAAEWAATVSKNEEKYLGGKYVVQGWVIKVTYEYSEGTMSFTLADDKDATEGIITAYKAAPVNETDLPDEGKAVELVGYLTKYNTTLEVIEATAKVLPEGPSTALENVNSEVKVVKVIENGQLVIIREGVRYNVLGARLN